MFLEEGEVDELERASFYFTHSHGQGTSWTAVHLKEEALRATCDTSEPQEVPTTVVTLLVPPPFYAPLQHIRTQLNDNIRCGPHITLVDPFMSVEGFEAAARRLRARLAQVEPFRISLEPFGYFKHKNACTLWLRPVDEPAGSLNRMQERILSAHPRYDRVNHLNGGGFQPHMSVAKFADKITMFKWMEENMHRFEGIEFKVREVYIMSRVGPDPSKYEVRHTIPLGQPTQQLPPYFPEIPLPDSVWLNQARLKSVPKEWTEATIGEALRGRGFTVLRVQVDPSRTEATIEFGSRAEKQRAITLAAHDQGLFAHPTRRLTLTSVF